LDAPRAIAAAGELRQAAGVQTQVSSTASGPLRPIVFIGGMGGSGTRAVARAVENLGYFAGSTNYAHDELVFKRLFMRPEWLRKGPGEKRIIARLKRFEEIITRGPPRDPKDGMEAAAGWMTKLPSSHFYVEQILKCWPQAVFIYVTRHPLDMAFSGNTFQVRNWGWYFFVDVGQFASLPAAQLEYWIRSEKRLSWLLRQHPGRIQPLRFDDFARDPVAELRVLLQALRLPPDEGLLAAACSHVAPPASTGRWRGCDLSQFSAEQLEFCRTAGWIVG
jgi:hypothetical protein